MLDWFRRRSHALAATLMLALAALGIPHSAEPSHDPDFAIGANVTHDASAHRMADGSETDGRSAHCAICHAARSFQPRDQVRKVATHIPEVVGLFDFEVLIAVSTPAVLQPSLRGPPASPATV